MMITIYTHIKLKKYYLITDREKLHKKYIFYILIAKLWYIIMKCKICNFEGKSLVSHINRKHNISVEEYKKKYNVKKVHVCTEKQRKLLSDKISYKYKNDLEYVKRVNENRSSIWDYKYWMNMGYSETEAKQKVSELQSKNSKKRDYTKSPSVLSISYWLKLGKTELEAKQEISKIQSKLSVKSSKFKGKKHSKESKEKISASLRKHIENTGISEWASHFHTSDKNKSLSYRSKSEIEIFNYVESNISDDVMANVYVESYNVDILLNNKIIEYFGDYWHCHKNLFEDSDIHPHTQKEVKEIREYDEIRIQQLLKSGYEVMIIWECEYNEDKEMVFDKIKKFLSNDS